MNKTNLADIIDNENLSEALNESIELADNPYLLFKSTYKKILFDDKRIIPKPPSIISIDESSIATAGNIITLSGQSKAGKSAVTSGMIAGMINPNPIGVDTLGFNIIPNTERQAVLHFDTEQSYYNWHRNQNNILLRANLSSKPDFYHSVYLREQDIAQRIESIEKSCKVLNEQFNGIHAVFIDGIADLVQSVNDEKECYDVISLLEKLSGKYNTVIIVIIHLNPGSSEKSRGHLGSHLERKSESMVSVTKQKGSDVSKVKPFLLRNAGGSDTPTIEFMWDKDKKQHSFIGYNYADNEKEKTKKEVGVETIIDILEENPSLSHTKLKKLLIEKTGTSESTAKRAITSAVNKGIIQKENGKYSLLIDTEETDNDDDDDIPF